MGERFVLKFETFLCQKTDGVCQVSGVNSLSCFTEKVFQCLTFIFEGMDDRIESDEGLEGGSADMGAYSV